MVYQVHIKLCYQRETKAIRRVEGF